MARSPSTLGGEAKSWEVSISSRRHVKVGPHGVAAMTPVTLIDAFKRTVARFGDRPALRFKNTKHGEFLNTSWRQYFECAQQFARAAISLGFKQREGIAILGFNSPEFLYANMAAILADGIAAGIYTTNGPEACRYIVNHANATIVVCDGEKQLEKFLQHREDMPQVLAYVVWGNSEAELSCSLHLVADLMEARRRRIFTFEQFVQLGVCSEYLTAELQRRMNHQSPEDVCTLVYTSGTMSMPKAVMISHDNVIFVATAVLDRFSADENERMVSYLPLSHVAAALLDVYGPMIVGFAITFAQPDALKGTLVDTLRLVRPTIFFGVPRVFEKIMERMLEFGNRSHCCIRTLSRWAKRVGTAATRAEETGQALPWGYSLAKILVYDRVRDALGLDACRFLVSAAAPMAPETLAYFASLNMPVHEVYGMSETTGPSTACLPGARKTGTCGRPLPGMELGVFPLRESMSPKHGAPMLAPGVQGEICMRGRHIMVGYKDDEANSAETIDDQGWLHSGDLGIIDTDGFLRITGRAKELIKTAGGENIPPLLIEDVIKEELKAISHAVVIGDRRRFLMVLLGLRTTVDPLGTPTDHLDSHALAVARDIGSRASSIAEAVTDPAFCTYISDGIRRANSRAISQAQHIQKWRIIPHDLSVNTGELTATLKIKRSVVAERFRELIEEVYHDGSAA